MAAGTDSYALTPAEHPHAGMDLPSRHPPLPQQPLGNVKQSGERPLIAIYNTHNSEAYRPSEGSDRFPDQNAGISRVAVTLARHLASDYGISVIRSTHIHDYPDMRRAYTGSGQTVRSILERHPSVRIVLDIHRDAGLKAVPVTRIKGEKVAQVLLVVGTYSRLPNPTWQQNEAFAKQLAAKMDQLYPGLSLGVRLLRGGYNQQLHPRSLLLEIGSDDTTLEAAEGTAKLLAHVLSEIIKDLGDGNPL